MSPALLYEFSGRRWRSFGDGAIASFSEVRCAHGTSARYSLGRVAALMGDVKATGAAR